MSLVDDDATDRTHAVDHDSPSATTPVYTMPATKTNGDYLLYEQTIGVLVQARLRDGLVEGIALQLPGYRILTIQLARRIFDRQTAYLGDSHSCAVTTTSNGRSVHLLDDWGTIAGVSAVSPTQIDIETPNVSVSITVQDSGTIGCYFNVFVCTTTTHNSTESDGGGSASGPAVYNGLLGTTLSTTNQAADYANVQAWCITGSSSSLFVGSDGNGGNGASCKVPYQPPPFTTTPPPSPTPEAAAVAQICNAVFAFRQNDGVDAYNGSAIDDSDKLILFANPSGSWLQACIQAGRANGGGPEEAQRARTVWQQYQVAVNGARSGNATDLCLRRSPRCP